MINRCGENMGTFFTDTKLKKAQIETALINSYSLWFQIHQYWTMNKGTNLYLHTIITVVYGFNDCCFYLFTTL